MEVDAHHTVEDTGLVFGDTLNKALGDRKGIKRYGHAVTPMDDALCAVTIDLSNRPYLVYDVPALESSGAIFNLGIAKEFFVAGNPVAKHEMSGETHPESTEVRRFFLGK